MTAHRYWRVYCAHNNNNSGGYFQINELEMHTTVGGSQACTGGTAISSTAYSGYPASQGFDGLLTDAKGFCSAGGPPAWLGYDFGAGNTVTIVEVAMYSYSTTLGSKPNTFTVDYSDNGSTWTTAWYVYGGGGNWSGNTWKTFSQPSNTLHVEATAVGHGHGISSLAAAGITTATAGDILVLCATAEWITATGASGTINTVTSSGLTWYKHGGHQFQTANGTYNGYVDMEIWWAYASTALSNHVVTASYNLPGGTNADGIAMAIIAVTGFTGSSYSVNPWDTNASLPYFANSNTSSNPTVAITTDTDNTMVIGFAGATATGSSVVFQPGGAGYSTVAFDTNTAGSTNDCTVAVEVGIATAALSGVNVTFPSNTYWGMFADALQQNPSLTGTIAVTESPDTFSATGLTSVYGDVAVNETVDTFAATGTITMAVVSGSIAVTDIIDTFAATGSVMNVISGSMAVTDTIDAFYATGSVANVISGSMAVTDTIDTFYATGSVPETIYGDMAVTEDSDVFIAFEGSHSFQTLSGDLSDGIRIGSSASMIGFKGGTLLSAIGIQSHISANWSRAAIIEEIVNLRHTLSAGSRYNVLVRDHALIRDALVHALPVTFHETIGIHSAALGVLGVLIVDGLRLRSVLSGSAHYYKVIAEGVRLNAALGRFVGASLSQGIGVHDALSRTYVSRPVITEGVTIASVLGRSLLVSCTMQEGVDLKEHDVLNAIYNQTISEDVQINASYIEPSGSVTTWAVNMRTGAATEYENYKFNSFAKMGNKYIGASQDGLYELDGDTDDGAQIIADIAGGFAQFGESHFASLKAVYLGVRGRGNFIFRLVEGDGTTRDYAVSANDMRTTRIDLGKGLRTRYWAYELISTGQDFDLDSIEFVPIVLQRRV